MALVEELYWISHRASNTRIIMFILTIFFTGVSLLKKLLDVGIYSCGTIRTRRKQFPQQLSQLKFANQGDSKVLQSVETPQLTATVWKDKKNVFYLSTNADPTGNATVLRRQRTGKRREVVSPMSVSLYQQHMNGVDRADQLRESYPAGRKSLKWWRYIFWYLLNTAVVNAMVCQKESPNHQRETRQKNPKPLKQLEF